MTQLPQVLVNVPVASGGVDAVGLLAADVTAWEERLGHTGRILVRPSGTEPLVRIMVEAPTSELANEVAAALRLALADATTP